MNHRTLMLFALCGLAIVFSLAWVWEFLIENVLLRHAFGWEEEPVWEQWEYVLTSTAFAALAFGIAVLILNRKLLAHVQTEKVLENSSRELEQTVRLRTAELKEGEGRVRSIANSAPFCLAYLDAENRFQFANDRFFDWFGLRPAEIFGKSMDSVLPVDLSEQFSRWLPRLLDGEPAAFEADIPIASGGTRNIRVNCTPRLEESGLARGYYAILDDLTDRKLLESQLRQSQKMDALGTLAGGVAHDLNNVLSPILGYADLLLEEAEPGTENHELLTILHQSAQRAKGLVAQVLLFSRRGQSEKAQIDMAEIAGEVMKLVRSTLPAGIYVLEYLPADSLYIRGNSSHVFQVMLNLCINSGQAMAESGILTLSIDAAELDGLPCLFDKKLTGDYVRLTVSDTGAGMTTETAERMFDPFFTTKGVGAGTGLGLSTVLGIVQEHDGGIHVTSQPGRGTTIEIYFPTAAPALMEPHRDVIARPRGNETVLVVDDEPTVLNLMRKILERSGYRVVTESDGYRAVHLISQEPGRFDLVVTDQSMPGLSGGQISELIRRVNTAMPIILCTGYSTTMTPESSRDIGINAFLYKPVEPATMVAEVRRVLDEAQQSKRAVS